MKIKESGVSRVGKKKKQEKLKKQKEKEEKRQLQEKNGRDKKKTGKTEKKKLPEKKALQTVSVKTDFAGELPTERKEKASDQSRGKMNNGNPDRTGAVDGNSGRAKAAGRSPGHTQGKNHVAAERFRALGDENRLRILTLLRDDRQLCAGDLLKSMNIVQSTLSHHMKVLTETGIVKCRRQGKWSYYSLNRDLIPDLDEMLDKWG